MVSFFGNVLLGCGLVRPHRRSDLSHSRSIMTGFLENQKGLLKIGFQPAVVWVKNVILLETIDQPSSGQVIGRKFNCDLVPSQDPDVVATHFAGDVS